MKQIVDKLNKIAKKIDESVEIPQTDLIIDSLDAITKAYGGTPNDSNLIVDKLEDIYNNISPAVSGNIEITENGENINVAPYATATVNVSGGGGDSFPMCTASIVNTNADNVSTTFNYVDGKLEYTPFEENATTVCHFLYLHYPADEELPEEYDVACSDAYGLSEEYVSNLVNLTLTNGSLVVTDPTLDSSCTIDAYAFARN